MLSASTKGDKVDSLGIITIIGVCVSAVIVLYLVFTGKCPKCQVNIQVINYDEERGTEAQVVLGTENVSVELDQEPHPQMVEPTAPPAPVGMAEQPHPEPPRSRVYEQSNENACCICLEEPKSVLLMPCRHLCICQACSQGPPLLRSCPICRANVQERLSIFV
jgi:hypothetical protein